jgi:hypothetical protein
MMQLLLFLAAISLSPARGFSLQTLPRSNIISPLLSAATPIQADSTQQSDQENVLQTQRKIVDEDEDPFTLLSTLAATTLLQSDRRRDAVGKDAGAQASSATNWIDEGSAFAFRKLLDKVNLWIPGGETRENNRQNKDEAIAWLRWMRSVPSPVVVDLSLEARAAANATVSDEFLVLLNAGGDSSETSTTSSISVSKMQQLRQDFLNRLQCKVILLPSGQGLRGGLVEPAGSLIFGRLLYGGVTRYRLLPSSTSGNSNTTSMKAPRRAGERTERKTSASEKIPTWVQYGGGERRYDSVDMGPCMIMEWGLMPKITGSHIDLSLSGASGDMVLRKLAWNPQNMFFIDEGDNQQPEEIGTRKEEPGFVGALSLSGNDRNEAFVDGFQQRVGGLGTQIDAIVRRVLDGRVIHPAEMDEKGNLLSYKEAKEQTSAQELEYLDGASKQLSIAALEAEELSLLGLTPVRGK